MKLLIIARGCPNQEDSVYGNFEYEQAVALSKKGIDVIYTYIDRRSRVGYKRKLGLSYHSGHPFPVYGGYLKPLPLKVFPRLSTWLYEKRYLQLFKIVIQKEGIPDLIHCHYLFNLPCAKAIKDKYGIKIVETEHWSEVNVSTPSFYIRYLSSYYTFADRIVTVSEALRCALKKNFNIESTRIYNMVSDTFFELHSDMGCGHSNKKIKLVSIGYLRFLKGFDLLIEALSFLDGSYTNWELTICGEGPERYNLQLLINNKGLEKKIFLVGRKGKDEIHNILKTSDIFVLPSRSETFGVVYIEAMACGLPVIASKCGGPEEFVTPDVGMLINKDDVDGLRDALVYMMTHFREYDALHIMQKCYQMFSPERIASEYVQTYNASI